MDPVQSLERPQPEGTAGTSVPEERRAEERTPTDAFGLFQIPGLEPWWECRIMNYASGGVWMRCGRELVPEIPVRLLLIPSSQVLVCEVRHTREENGLWLHGMQIMSAEPYGGGP